MKIKELRLGLKLLFYPHEIDADSIDSTEENFRIGALLAALGFILQGIFMIPEDEIRIGLESPYDAIFNTIIGAIGGLVFLFLLIGFITASLRFLDLTGENNRKIIAGSVAPFFMMPFFTVPIHLFFRDQLALRGNFWIVIVLVVIFLLWHVSLLKTLIGVSYPEIFEKKERQKKFILLFTIMLGLSILFLILIPWLTNNTTISFWEGYF